MIELKNQIDHLIELISSTTDCFYQQKNQAGYQQLTVLIGEIATIMDKVFAVKAEQSGLFIEEDKLVCALQEIVNAMEEKDWILVSDVLSYDLLEQFQEIKQQLI